MSSTMPAANLEPFYVFVAVIILALVRVTWRIFANYRGTAFSLARTVAYAGVYIALGVAFSVLSFFEGVPNLVAVPGVILAAAAAFWSYGYSYKRISFWRTSGGSLYFRGGIAIYLIYLAGFLARLALDVAFIGPSMFGFASVVRLSGTALYASMAADMLLILGVGLLLGRNVRVARRYRMIQRSEETVPSAPIPRGVLAR